MATTKELPLRLSFRVEGDWWNAYVAAPNKMDGARHIGSILMAAVRDNQDRKQAFMDLMQSFLGDIIAEVFGSQPEWSEPVQAPQSERAGRA